MKEDRMTDWKLFAVGIFLAVGGASTMVEVPSIDWLGALMLWFGGCLQAWAAPYSVINWVRSDTSAKA